MAGLHFGHDENLENKEAIFASVPMGMPKESDLQVKENAIKLAIREGSGDVWVKLMNISLDPCYRNQMIPSNNPDFPSFQIGKPLQGAVIGKVVASDNAEFDVGDLVIGTLSFSEHVLVPGGKGLQKLNSMGLPPSYFLGVCAWVGLKLIGQPKPGDQVYVSAALGAVGQIVGQLAKICGCRVVGSTSTDEKVELLKTEYGYDDAFNYRKDNDLDAALTKYFPKGIGVYFDTVGGETLDAVFHHVNLNTRIAMCGATSQMNLEYKDRYGLKNMMDTITLGVTVKTYLVSHYFADYLGPFLEEVVAYLKAGKLKFKEHITDGIENLPAAFVGMMNGKNVGKAVVRVSVPTTCSSCSSLQLSCGAGSLEMQIDMKLLLSVFNNRLYDTLLNSGLLWVVNVTCTGENEMWDGAGLMQLEPAVALCIAAVFLTPYYVSRTTSLE